MKFYELFESDGFKKLQQTVTRIQESVGPIIQRIQEQLGPVMEQIGKVGKVIGEYFETKDKLDNILLDYDWPPILHLPRYVMDNILAAYDTLVESEFIRCLELQLRDYLSEDYFSSIVDDWSKNSLLQERMKLLREAISCHNDGNYYASVILLLSQLEGMVANGFYHSSNMNGKTYKKYLELLFSENPTQKETAVKDFILKRVLVSFDYGSPISSTISRHAIMHGADTSFGTYLNSIKALLLVDYLQDYFGFVRVEGSKRYHIHGCNYVKRTTSTIEVSKYLSKFKEDGCLLCGVCIGHNDVS